MIKNKYAILRLCGGLILTLVLIGCDAAGFIPENPIASWRATETSQPPTPLPATATPAAVATETPDQQLTQTEVNITPVDTVAPPATEPPATEPPATEAVPTSTAAVPTAASETSNTPPTDLHIVPEKVFVYPVPHLFSGDQATFQLAAFVPQGIEVDNIDVWIVVNDELTLASRLNSRNLGGDIVGIYQWVWDTTGLVGEQQIELIIDPEDKILQGDTDQENNRHQMTVNVRPRNMLPILETDAQWVTRETEYARVHVVSGTAAERDLAFLMSETDLGIDKAIQQLNETPNRKFDIYFIDRIIGQGGYAGGSMVVSYLDRNYAGGELAEVITHESIHLLDRQFTPRFRLNFLAEGVAVWASGGHYKPEDLDRRGAALIRSGQYVPLTELINNFYPVQHEIGYLEAGSFISYLVAQYGWPAVREFYSDVETRGYSSPATAVDAHLQKHFGKTLPQLENEWNGYLMTIPDTEDEVADLNATVRFYNVMRSYQQAYDPTAYFLTAWLTPPDEARERGFTATLTRNPEDTINVVLETMLTMADIALREGDFKETQVLLDSVERVLDGNGTFIDPLAIAYRDIVVEAAVNGYEVHYITFKGSTATAQVTNPYSPSLLTLTFIQVPGGWKLSQ